MAPSAAAHGAVEVLRDHRVSALRSAADLAAIVPQWEALWQRVPHATPFQHPAWLVPWWSAFAHGELWTMAIWRGDRLVGVLPLYRELDGTLLPVGVGLTDWIDALVEHDVPLATLLTSLPEWTGCTQLEIPCLNESAVLYTMPAPAGALDAAAPGEPCPCLPLPATIAGLGAVVPAGQLHNVQRGTAKAARLGRVALRSATRETAPELLEQLIQLHAARWSERGEAGVLVDPAVQTFHRAAVHTLAAAGLLRIYGLYIGERVGAVYYGLGDGRRAYAYLSGFDPELSSLSPGMLVLGHAIDEAVREGATAMDFLRGREAYKYRWGAVDRPSWVRRLTWP